MAVKVDAKVKEVFDPAKYTATLKLKLSEASSLPSPSPYNYSQCSEVNLVYVAPFETISGHLWPCLIFQTPFRPFTSKLYSVGWQ